jgi:hypothetical protein
MSDHALMQINTVLNIIGRVIDLVIVYLLCLGYRALTRLERRNG